MFEAAAKTHSASESALLVEYAAANDVYLTYDGFRWQAGSFLIAGVFVYWGFIIGSPAPETLMVSSSLHVGALMSCWLLFAHHYRQLYMFKLHRLHEIERLLGMEQHLRFTQGAPSGIRYRSRGSKGHNIDIYVYVLTSCGGTVLAVMKNGFSLWGLLIVPLVAIVVVQVTRNERAMLREFRSGFAPTVKD